MIKFFIEVSYWSAYFMKWKSEKEIPFSMGIGSILSISFCNILTIITFLQLYTSYPALDKCMELIPEGILTKENKWLIVFAILPIIVVVEKFIETSVYKKHNKKELFTYFEQMSPHRKLLGKMCFILYSVTTIAIALFLANKVGKDKFIEDKDLIRQERIELIRQQLRQIDSTSQDINE